MTIYNTIVFRPCSCFRWGYIDIVDLLADAKANIEIKCTN